MAHEKTSCAFFASALDSASEGYKHQHIPDTENLRRVVDEIRTFWMTPSNYFFIPNLTAETAEIC